MDTGLIISLVGVLITFGGLCVAFGVLKAKISENAKTNEEQSKQMADFASKPELETVKNRGDEQLAEAIKHSDSMLELMRHRAEEDRATGEGRYKELYGIISNHTAKITALETSHTTVLKTLDEIKTDINTGFRDVREELKELRKGN